MSMLRDVSGQCDCAYQARTTYPVHRQCALTERSKKRTSDTLLFRGSVVALAGTTYAVFEERIRVL